MVRFFNVIKLLLFFLINCCSARDVTKFDFAWRHFLGMPSIECPPGVFKNQSAVQCGGLDHHTNGDASAKACQDVCCENPSCKIWQWCDASKKGCGCWAGQCNTDQHHNTGWVGGERTSNVTASPADPKYDDSKWELVDAPHDFIIGQKYNEKTPGSGGSYLPRNDAWYRKHFKLPEDWKGSSIWIYFEGVFRTAGTYINGVYLGTHPTGYTSFFHRLDNVTKLNYGDSENVLALFVDGAKGSGWWYEGAGIYRHVYLVRASPQHIEVDGIFAPAQITGKIQSRSTPSDGHSADSVVSTSATVNNYANSPASIKVRFTLIDNDAKKVASVETNAASIASKDKATLHANFTVKAAELWSVPRPYLYTLTSEVLGNDGKTLDAVDTTIGIRSIRYTGDKGFFMNEQHVKVRGFCDHSSFGGVGMGVYDRINLYRAQLLRSVGGNGWRMSHNPPIPGLLDILDRTGVVVMDENRRFGDEPQYVMNMGALVKRDRNHPSIAVWSFCNEGGCGSKTAGAPFRNISYYYDGTRPVLGNHVSNTDLNKYMDVQGFSHKGGSQFDNYHKQFPKKPTYASECCSCQTMRGEDVSNSSAPGPGVLQTFNANCVSEQTNRSNGRDYVSGTMVWTLFDYYGESHGWPHVISMYGSFDVAGFAKSAVYWYRSWWLAKISEDSDDRPPLGPSHQCHIVEHWQSSVGGPTRTVHVYSDLSNVELYINGKSQGLKTMPNLQWAQWDKLKFEAGNLTAVCYDQHNIKSHSVFTDGKAVAIQLTIDAPSPATGTGKSLVADGQDVALLRASVVDANGRLIHTSDANITFTVTHGPGRVVATHNGDVRNHEPNLGSWHSAYHGLARGIVQVTVDAASSKEHRSRLIFVDVDGNRVTNIADPEGVLLGPHDITVTASSPGLTSGTVTIPVSTSEDDKVLATAQRNVIY